MRGKTGHLRSVASLSGVVSASDGRRLAFSVMINGGRGGRQEVDDAIDAFIEGLADASWGDLPSDVVEGQGVTGD